MITFYEKKPEVDRYFINSYVYYMSSRCSPELSFWVTIIHGAIKMEINYILVICKL